MREELESLAGRPVGEVTAETTTLPDAPILVGTEAVLHRVGAVDGVAFLDFDQELLAPRYRAGEEALVLLARASRLVGGRERGGSGPGPDPCAPPRGAHRGRGADPARWSLRAKRRWCRGGVVAGCPREPTPWALVSGPVADGSCGRTA